VSLAEKEKEVWLLKTVSDSLTNCELAINFIMLGNA
jgi:hypothetical protein